MYLNIIDTFCHMRRYRFRNILCPNCRNGQTHCQKIVRIFPKDLSVSEISPSADCLSKGKSHDTGISHKKKILFFYLCINKCGQESRDHSTVNCHAAFPSIDYAQKIISITIPIEDHIINSGTDNGKNHGINGKVPIQVRILSRYLSQSCCHQDTGDYADTDDHSIKCYRKPKHLKAFGHVPQVNPQIGKCNIH